MPVDDAPSDLILDPGLPALVAGVAMPVVALGLIAYRATASGLASRAEDPVSPWVVAALTMVFALIVLWRLLTQRAMLGPQRLRCRNLTGTFSVEWEQVERIEIVERPGLVMVDVHVRGLRRRQRMGAATRFPGDDADVVRDILAAHPRAAALLDDVGS